MDNSESPDNLDQNPMPEEKKEEEKKEEKKSAPDEKITLSSRKRWFWLSVIITVLNPVFAGLILGVFFLSEPDLKKEGRTILILAIVFGFIHGYLQLQLMPWMIQQGLI